MKKNPVSDGAV